MASKKKNKNKKYHAIVKHICCTFIRIKLKDEKKIMMKKVDYSENAYLSSSSSCSTHKWNTFFVFCGVNKSVTHRIWNLSKNLNHI